MKNLIFILFPFFALNQIQAQPDTVFVDYQKADMLAKLAIKKANIVKPTRLEGESKGDSVYIYNISNDELKVYTEDDQLFTIVFPTDSLTFVYIKFEKNKAWIVHETKGLQLVPTMEGRKNINQYLDIFIFLLEPTAKPASCLTKRDAIPIIALNPDQIRVDTAKFDKGRIVNGQMLTCTDLRKTTPNDLVLASSILYEAGWIENEGEILNFSELRQAVIADIPPEKVSAGGFGVLYLVLLNENLSGIMLMLPETETPPNELMCKDINLSK